MSLTRPARKSPSRCAGARNRPPPGLKRRPLDLALEFDPGQRPGAGWPEVVGGHGDDQAGVGERRVAARQAHAVDHHTVGLGGGRHDPAARTHAEAVDAALGGVGGQLVERRRQLGVAGRGAVLNLDR